MHPMLNTAITAARRAGSVINRASLDLDKVQVSRKQRNDFVTEVDKEAERVIIDTLLKAYPGHSILGEESGLDARKKGDTLRTAENIWVIDPLDGTTNFIHGMPQYCTSIALMQKGVAQQAVIYDPNRDELFTATRGRGAFLNDRRIRVSKRTKIEDSLIGTGFPYRELESLDTYMKMFKAVTITASAVPPALRTSSTVSLEAGGIISDFDGESEHLYNGQVVAGNPKVFGAMLTLLGKARG